jgi:anti-anti-sigma regulatory factor
MELPFVAGPAGAAVVFLDREYSSLVVKALSEIEECLMDAIAAPSSGVLIDSDATRYFGCGFLNVLLRCRIRAQCSQRRIVLFNLKEFPRDVITFGGLAQLWELSTTRACALAILSPETPHPAEFNKETQSPDSGQFDLKGLGQSTTDRESS